MECGTGRGEGETRNENVSIRGRRKKNASDWICYVQIGRERRCRGERERERVEKRLTNFSTYEQQFGTGN